MVSRPERVIGDIIAQYQEVHYKPLRAKLDAWTEFAKKYGLVTCSACSGPMDRLRCDNHPTDQFSCGKEYCTEPVKTKECHFCGQQLRCMKCFLRTDCCQKDICFRCAQGIRGCFSCGFYCTCLNAECERCGRSECPKCGAHKCEPLKRLKH